MSNDENTENNIHSRGTDHRETDDRSPAAYLETAAEVRERAERSKDSTTKAVLLKMASLWERLAGLGRSHQDKSH
jgi:hypothetical protein